MTTTTLLDALSPDLVTHIASFERLPRKWVICIKGYDSRHPAHIYIVNPDDIPLDIQKLLLKYNNAPFDSAANEYSSGDDDRRDYFYDFLGTIKSFELNPETPAIVERVLNFGSG